MSMEVSDPGSGDRISDVLELYHEVESMLAKVASRGNKLQLTVLILSVLTSGSLWLLVSKSIPQPAIWFGAVASTLTTGITLYLKTVGISLIRSKCLAAFHDIGQFLAEVRASADMSEEVYWRKYKELEFRVTEIRYGLHGQES